MTACMTIQIVKQLSYNGNTDDNDRQDLNEDKSSRRKALAEMRAWIKTTPGINHCRTDNSFLLRFLR